MSDEGVGDGQGTQTEGPLALDPFSFHNNVASRIAGLGGDEPSPDPTHVFHTPYVQAARGPNSFTLRFAGLTARRGTLLVRVHMLPDEPGAAAHLINSERIQLNRLASMGGELRIPFEGFRDVTFAVLGLIQDDTDASAETLEVLLDHPHTGIATGRAAHAEVRSTSYGTSTIRPAARLMSLDRATLAEPVSQSATAAQFAERAFADWQRRLGETRETGFAGWRHAFLAQSFDRYGVLAPGAAALAFEMPGGPIAALVAGEGLRLTVVHPEEVAEDALVERLRRPKLCGDADWAERVRLRTARLPDIPEDIANHDLCWSLDVANRFDTLPQAFSFLETSMECLRPGGLAVHVFDVDLFNHVGPERCGLFRRADLERLGLNLISRGHEVAQLRPVSDLADPERPVPFGLIARRARTQL